jgi:hypothetical protein
MGSRSLVLAAVVSVFLTPVSFRPSPAGSSISPVVFVASPADPDRVARLVPRGNINPRGGHVRPVKHMYMDYLDPFGGGGDATPVVAMADGHVVMVVVRQNPACLTPDPSGPDGCADGPDSRLLVDEYQVFIQHGDRVTSYYDHLHELDASLRLPGWRDEGAGWITFGTQHVLFLGLNGAPPPVRVHPRQGIGVTRNYFGSWDIGVVDTARIASFLGSGPLRYPTLRDIIGQSLAEGGPGIGLAPDQPFPGEMFVNSSVFIDYLIPPLAAAWRAKLAGDGSGGRPDWDVRDTLQGTWYRADVTALTFANMTAAEDNAMSFSPYNLDPSAQSQLGFGDSFFANVPPLPPGAPPAAIAALHELVLSATARLGPGLRFTPDRTPGSRHNPDPLLVPSGGYACYDVPDPVVGDGEPFDGQTQSLVVYLPVRIGVQHLVVRYVGPPCATVLAAIDANPALLEAFPWWGDYVR